MLVMLPLGASIAHLSMGQNLAREQRDSLAAIFQA